jgi:Ca2+-transporting ATPase
MSISAEQRKEGLASGLERHAASEFPAVSSRGLTSDLAARRLAEYGPNEIAREHQTPQWVILARQFGSPVVWLLIGASVISAALGKVADAVAVASIVLLNGLVGYFQEHRAERAIAALRSMTAPQARVLRDGRSALIPAADVVPGDTLLVEAGDIVAADARLVEAHVVSTNEAALTGESAPVAKSTAPAPAGAPLAERHDFVFTGTAVATGSGVAEVVATGMNTELGKIAHLLAKVDDTITPLEQRLARVSRGLLFICLGIVAVVAAAGVRRGWPAFEILMSAVSLAVAAVPEGLPAVVTIALAIGVQRMAGRHVLIRRLPAVETLGCATVICTDKTGTLTTGVMTVRELWGPDHERLLFAAAACCDAELSEDGRGGVGDPTELAILAAAAERGIQRDDIERTRPRVVVNPFDSDRKRMSIARADGFLYLKGAVEVVLSLCDRVLAGAAETHDQMAARGLRVLAVALTGGREERNLELLGLVGMADPPLKGMVGAGAGRPGGGGDYGDDHGGSPRNGPCHRARIRHHPA